MRLPRPHVPIRTKVAVAARQARVAGFDVDWRALRLLCGDDQLRVLLNCLFPGAPCQLDHDPPLWSRVRTAAGNYRPPANHQDYLVWRSADDHRIKTYVKGDGAQLSDAGKRRKEIKRRRKAEKPKWQWPKRKMRPRSR